MKPGAETGGQADAGADVLGDGWLKKGETHSKATSTRGRTACRGQYLRIFLKDVRPQAAIRRKAGPGGNSPVALKDFAPDRVSIARPGAAGQR
jgi:hypothetical protein